MLKLWWSEGIPNAGDYFGHYLVEKLGYPNELTEPCPELVTAGSVLGFSRFKSKPKIWGAGFHNAVDWLHNDVENVYAVRGKLSYQKLNTTKEIALGDPGLLASYVYKPKTTKKFKYGIIAHYVDIDDFKKMFPNARVISMKTRNIEEVLDAINECEFTFSSSLHGIVFSHSLGIPCIHIEHNKLYSENNFKFWDYYSVFDSIKYVKEKAENVDFDKYLSDDWSKYCPTKNELQRLQNGLLNSFPYENKFNNTSL